MHIHGKCTSHFPIGKNRTYSFCVLTISMYFCREEPEPPNIITRTVRSISRSISRSTASSRESFGFGKDTKRYLDSLNSTDRNGYVGVASSPNAGGLRASDLYMRDSLLSRLREESDEEDCE